MLEYWALANVLNMREKVEADKSEASRKVCRPAVKYLGIDAIKWNYSMEKEAGDRDLVKSQDKPCEGCEKSAVPCEMSKEQRMTNTKYICDLIIKFERR